VGALILNLRNRLLSATVRNGTNGAVDCCTWPSIAFELCGELSASLISNMVHQRSSMKHCKIGVVSDNLSTIALNYYKSVRKPPFSYFVVSVSWVFHSRNMCIQT
jgi:hypothetical protein